MEHVAMLKKYLKSRGHMSTEVGEGYPFVTVSRQSGAGGHVLAREIVRAAEANLPRDLGQGWEVFDHRLCLLIAQDPELSASFDSLLAEHYRSEASLAIEELIIGESRQYRTMKRIFEVVRGLCTIGKVVIVGRAGSCVAADLPLHVSVRLVADVESRVGHMAKFLDLSRVEAGRLVRKQDRERAKLLYDFFSKDVNDPLEYDLVMNTDRMDFKEMADATVSVLNRRILAAERE